MQSPLYFRGKCTHVSIRVGYLGCADAADQPEGGRGAPRRGRADRRAGGRDVRPQRGPGVGAQPRGRARGRAGRAAAGDARVRTFVRSARGQARVAVPAQRGRRAAHPPGCDRRVRSGYRPAGCAARRRGDHRHPHRGRLGPGHAALGPGGRRHAGDPRHGRAGPLARTRRHARACVRGAAGGGAHPLEGRGNGRGAGRRARSAHRRGGVVGGGLPARGRDLRGNARHRAGGQARVARPPART